MKKTNIKKIICLCILTCAYTLSCVTAQTHKAKSSTAKKSGAKSGGVMNLMTVLKLAPPPKGSDYMEVLFSSSEHVFKLSVKANAAYAKRLKESLDKHIAVYVKRASEDSYIIQSVIVPGTPGQKKKK